MTCLTKQHSQTQKFLLRLFSHHWIETQAVRSWGVTGWGDETRRQNERKTEKSGAGREETFLWHETKYNYQRDILVLDRIYVKRKGSRDLLEWKVHALFRNVFCMEFSSLLGSWSAMTWLAVGLRVRRLIGCDTSVHNVFTCILKALNPNFAQSSLSCLFIQKAILPCVGYLFYALWVSVKDSHVTLWPEAQTWNFTHCHTVEVQFVSIM